jgi:membrane protein insertase Oxa1/YidC/SpoIIIJ
MSAIFYTIIIYPITQILEFVFYFSNKLFRETGISVVCVSAAISILCLPLYTVAEHWQQIERGKQNSLKRKRDRINAAFSGDERYMILSTYYRQRHYHPVYAMRSTFGLLIQIPFFIAAYSWLSHLEILKGASFLFIADLGSPDNLIPLGNGLNLLPFCMTAINCVAGAIYTRGFPLKERIQIYGMSAVFLVLLYNSPAGLVLYWTMNNIFSLLKHCYIKLNFNYKKHILFGALSLAFLFCAYYIKVLHTGTENVRGILFMLFIIAALFPWIVITAQKIHLRALHALWPEKGFLVLFTVSCLLVWSITGVFLPSMLIVSSPEEFSFIDTYTSPLIFILTSALQTAGFFVLWPLCLFFLFSGKWKKYFSFAAFLICIIVLVNVFIFPGSYGYVALDLTFSDGIDHSAKESFMNAFLLLVIMLFLCVLFFVKITYKILPVIVSALLFASVGLSFNNVIDINREYKQFASHYVNPVNKTENAVEPVFHLSKNGHNTIVLMLDRAINCLLPVIFEENPVLNKQFSGFTWYPNTVSFHKWTRLGAPPLFGGYEYTPVELARRADEPMVKKHNEALLLMPRIFSDAGFSVVVGDQPYQNYSERPDTSIYEPYRHSEATGGGGGITPIITEKNYTALWLSEHGIVLPSESEILFRNIFWYSVLKISPIMFREAIYAFGDYCSPRSGKQLLKTVNWYSVLDYLPRLTDTNAEKENTAVIFTNNTTHEPSFMQAPEYRPALPVTNFGSSPFPKRLLYHVNAAALLRLGEWFDYLKEAGVYDNTRIIIAADHGAGQVFMHDIKDLPFIVEQYNPLLLVKDFNASGTLKTDMTFMSNADVPFLAFEGQIENPVNPFTKQKITNNHKQAPLHISIDGSIHISSDGAAVSSGDYLIHDNIFEPGNWERIGK